MNNLLLESGQPNLPELIAVTNRCTPPTPGGLQWVDEIRFNRWPNQFSDGRKHDRPNDPKGAAFPWDGASDCRPFIVDGIINERVAMKTTAFWRSMLRPGVADDEASGYAVRLAEHLITTVLYEHLTREVELSAQYEEHYGWTVLGVRWRREISLKRRTVSFEAMQVAASEAPEGSFPRLFVEAIKDPTREDEAIELAQQYYREQLVSALPEDLREEAPDVPKKVLRKAIVALRTEGNADVPVPYLCKSEPEICALQPWVEVAIPPELTAADELVVQFELVSKSELDNRILTEGYDAKWVEEAKKQAGQQSSRNLPISKSGFGLSQLGGNPVPLQHTQDIMRSELVELCHATYRATDADGVPGVYMTTFHRAVGGKAGELPLCAKHGLAESVHGGLPYVAGAREWWCRSVTASRGVPELAATDQNLMKGLLDNILDRASITTVPPMNVYDNPLKVNYRVSPMAKNLVTRGREPGFMDLPGGNGLVDGLKAYDLIRAKVDNYFGLQSENVPATRLQMSQEMAVSRFLILWSRALQMALCLCQRYLPDADFAEITGAPAGWLDAHRDDRSVLRCELHFDVRELDPELAMKQIEAVNQVVLPSDVMGTVNRGKWAKLQLRAINPAWAKEVIMDDGDASQQLFEKTRNEVIQMFAGNQPRFLDKMDPTAKAMLDFTKQIVLANPEYLRSLNDDALIALAGPQAPMLAQQIGQRTPNERFSSLLVKWLENLKFNGVTQPANRQIGRIGVDPEAEQ